MRSEIPEDAGKPGYDEVLRRLQDRKETLPPRLQEVARFVLNNPEDVAILTISELARAAGVQPSTVTRFTQELGIERFPDLQAAFRERLVGPRQSHADRLRDLSQSALRSRDDLDLGNPQDVLKVFSGSAYDSLLNLVEDQADAPLERFVEVLRAAPVVFIAGGRGAFGVASYSFYGFSTVGKRAVLVDNAGAMREQQLFAMSDADVLLAIGFDDYTPETIELAESAAAQGRQVLAITDNELSPLANLSSCCLFVREARLGHFRSQVPAMVLCQAIIASVGRSGDRQIGPT